MDWSAAGELLFKVGALLVGGWIGSRLHNAGDQARAQAIATIAADAAAAVVANNPRLPWTELVQQAVLAIANAAGLSVDSPVARRAAIGALTRLGIKQ